jgi:lipopolysaccharide export LptBFGC system permease protein LptF
MMTIAGSISVGVFVLAVAVFGDVIQVEGRSAQKAKAAIPAEQVIVSIRTAIAAKPGNLLGVEVENKGGKTLCEVEILTPDGKTYEVEVDVVNNAVVEIELDDDDDDEHENDKGPKSDKDDKP